MTIFVQRQLEETQDALNSGKSGNSPTRAPTGTDSREPCVANSSTGSDIVSVHAVSIDSSSLSLPATDHFSARTASPSECQGSRLQYDRARIAAPSTKKSGKPLAIPSKEIRLFRHRMREEALSQGNKRELYVHVSCMQEETLCRVL